jgi:hypothetical protein
MLGNDRIFGMYDVVGRGSYGEEGSVFYRSDRSYSGCLFSVIRRDSERDVPI